MQCKFLENRAVVYIGFRHGMDIKYAVHEFAKIFVGTVN